MIFSCVDNDSTRKRSCEKAPDLPKKHTKLSPDANVNLYVVDFRMLAF